MTGEALWSEVTADLRATLNEATYATWFAQASPGELTDESFCLEVPNDVTRERIERRFLGLLRDLVSYIAGRQLRIALTVRHHDPPAAVVPGVPSERERSEPHSTASEPRFTFENFVVGPSNLIAHAAALAVAEAPARTCNPLFVYGGSGLGKTHLLQAIRAHVGEHSRRTKTLYVAGETFVNDLVDALREQEIEDFRQRYCDCDLLLVDDIRFSVQARLYHEIFHTFSTMVEAGGQVVISCSRPPHDLAAYEGAMRSWVEGCLLTVIQPPDLETRVAILRRKVENDRIPITDTDVLPFIAERAATSVRQLEGALTRVVAYASLTGRVADPELADEVLQDLAEL